MLWENIKAEMRAPTHLPHRFDPFFEKMEVTMACQVPRTYHVTVKPPELLHLQWHEPYMRLLEIFTVKIPTETGFPFFTSWPEPPSTLLLSCHKGVDWDTQKAVVGSEVGCMFLTGSVTRWPLEIFNMCLQSHLMFVWRNLCQDNCCSRE